MPPGRGSSRARTSAAVAEKYISMTPLHLDLTDYRSMEVLEEIAKRKSRISNSEAPDLVSLLKGKTTVGVTGAFARRDRERDSVETSAPCTGVRRPDTLAPGLLLGRELPKTCCLVASPSSWSFLTKRCAHRCSPCPRTRLVGAGVVVGVELLMGGADRLGTASSVGLSGIPGVGLDVGLLTKRSSRGLYGSGKPPPCRSDGRPCQPGGRSWAATAESTTAATAARVGLSKIVSSL